MNVNRLHARTAARARMRSTDTPALACLVSALLYITTSLVYALTCIKLTLLPMIYGASRQIIVFLSKVTVDTLNPTTSKKKSVS